MPPQLASRPRFRALPPRDSMDPVAQALHAWLTSSLSAFLDPERLQLIAEDHGCFSRYRVHHCGLVAVSLILSAMQPGADTQGRWLDAQAIYERLGGPRSDETSFGRVVRHLRPLFIELIHRRARLLERDLPGLRGRLAAFADVLVPDGCAFKIAAALAGTWPGTGTPAEFKLHAVYSVRAGGPAGLATSAGSLHDNVGFGPATWVAGALYIWDLGYEDHARFVDATLVGSYVLQRLKRTANPLLWTAYDAAGRPTAIRDPQGRPMHLNRALEFGCVPAHPVLDLEVCIEDGDRSVLARVVCVPWQGEDRYYLTTLPRALFTPHDVAEIYRIRWEVELFFRELKGAVRLDEVRRMATSEGLQVALLASLLAALLGHEVAAALHDVATSGTVRGDVRPDAVPDATGAGSHAVAGPVATAPAVAFPPGGVRRRARRPDA